MSNSRRVQGAVAAIFVGFVSAASAPGCGSSDVTPPTGSPDGGPSQDASKDGSPFPGQDAGPDAQADGGDGGRTGGACRENGIVMPALPGSSTSSDYLVDDSNLYSYAEFDSKPAGFYRIPLAGGEPVLFPARGSNKQFVGRDFYFVEATGNPDYLQQLWQVPAGASSAVKVQELPKAMFQTTTPKIVVSPTDTYIVEEGTMTTDTKIHRLARGGAIEQIWWDDDVSSAVFIDGSLFWLAPGANAASPRHIRRYDSVTKSIQVVMATPTKAFGADGRLGRLFVDQGKLYAMDDYKSTIFSIDTTTLATAAFISYSAGMRAAGVRWCGHNFPIAYASEAMSGGALFATCGDSDRDTYKVMRFDPDGGRCIVADRTKEGGADRLRASGSQVFWSDPGSPPYKLWTALSR